MNFSYRLGAEEWNLSSQQQLSESLSGGGDVVVYVHGYNEGFAKSCRRAIWLGRKLGILDRLVLISWPSDGNVLNYTRDEADAMWASRTIRSALDAISTRTQSSESGPESGPAPGNIQLIAHSMGTRAVSYALIQHPIAPQLIDQLIFIAADMDSEIFYGMLPQLQQSIQRLHIYQSANDAALQLSEQLHGYSRLGQPDAELEARIPTHERIQRYDISAHAVRIPGGHHYHFANPVVLQQLAEILR